VSILFRFKKPAPTFVHDRSNPDTEMLEEVLATFSFANGLLDCPKVFVFDGVKVKDKAQYRQGQVTEEGARNYEEFKARVRKLSQEGGLFANSQMLECEERQGFGYALREAINKPGLITTPYVIVVQHDRTFMRSVDLHSVILAMDAHKELFYVGFPTSSVLNHGGAPETSEVRKAKCSRGFEGYMHFVASKYKVHIASHVLVPPELGGAKLVPLVQWYDSTHVCRLQYYRDFVYSRKKLRVKKGGFIEDKLGQQQLQEIKEGGMDAFAPYGTYILDDLSDQVSVSHLNGRSVLAHSQRRFKFAGQQQTLVQAHKDKRAEQEKGEPEKGEEESQEKGEEESLACLERLDISEQRQAAREKWQCETNEAGTQEEGGHGEGVAAGQDQSGGAASTGSSEGEGAVLPQSEVVTHTTAAEAPSPPALRDGDAAKSTC
jgi:hypothetical protein